MKEFIENQYKNLFLWTPFLAAFGAAIYFSCDYEPNFIYPILITILSAAVIFKNKNIVIRAFALWLFGFFYAMSFTHIINTLQINDSFGEITISGEIKDIDFTNDSARIFLKIPMNQIREKYPENEYVNIRMTFKDTNTKFNIGDTITGHGLIFRPSPKYAPDSFDFARYAYFTNLSGTGFFTDYEITPLNTHNNLRNRIHNQAKSNLTDALVLGYKKSISDTERQIWKSIGLGHVWSISGFHMTLVGGWLFALFYFLFRLMPPITKRIPAKYPALICAWLGLLFYLFISGINVATIRAFLMTTVIFTATIFGRGVLSLRNATLVFWIIFLLNPFYVLHPGFQLSFAAIFGLLWFFNDQEYIKRSFSKHILHIVYLTLMTAIIATLFTLPFIISNFGVVPIYSLISNLIILPIFSILIMPLIMIGTVCAMFGNMFFINIAHIVYQHTLHTAEYISNLPHSEIIMPHISTLALSLCIVGMLCIIFIVKSDSEKFVLKHINIFIGAMFILSGLIVFIATPRPLFYATDDHKLVGFVVDNKIQFNKSRSSQHYFAFDTWQKINNEIPTDKNAKYKCSKGLCIYKTPNWNLVYMQKFTTIMDNITKICNDETINYIVTPFDTEPEKCYGKILKEGIFIYPSGHVKNFSNHRPWHIAP